MAAGEQTIDAALVVIAKEPIAGRVKTRLSPPLSPAEACGLAEAALLDTLAVMRATPAARRFLLLDGAVGDWPLQGIEVLQQRGGGLAARLADGFADVDGPALLIGMDTPQITPQLLCDGLRRLASQDHDAVLAHTHDGGYWTIGLCRPDRRVFEGVPMSTASTGAAQLERLRELGLRTRILPTLRDIDRYEDALVVASEAPATRFAQAFAALAHGAIEVAV